MRIALIRPGLGVLGKRRYSSLACMEPLALAILAGLTPDEHTVQAFDDRFETIPYDEPFDLVALSVGTFQARRAYEIADRFRQRSIPVVMGGFHVAFCPDEALEHARLAHDLRPEDPGIISNLGLALMEIGRFDEAHHHFQRALKIDPGDEIVKRCLKELETRTEDAKR